MRGCKFNTRFQTPDLMLEEKISPCYCVSIFRWSLTNNTKFSLSSPCYYRTLLTENQKRLSCQMTKRFRPACSAQRFHKSQRPFIARNITLNMPCSRRTSLSSYIRWSYIINYSASQRSLPRLKGSHIYIWRLWTIERLEFSRARMSSDRSRASLLVSSCYIVWYKSSYVMSLEGYKVRLVRVTRRLEMKQRSRGENMRWKLEKEGGRRWRKKEKRGGGEETESRAGRTWKEKRNKILVEFFEFDGELFNEEKKEPETRASFRSVFSISLLAPCLSSYSLSPEPRLRNINYPPSAQRSPEVWHSIANLLPWK